MQEDNPLQRAITAARAGRELTARDMFLDIVKDDPRNEVAWMWLTGLLDDPDDCIEACERILEINPKNTPARQYLNQLLERRNKELDSKKALADEQALAVREAVRAKKPEGSLEAIRDLTRQEYVSVEAWRLLAEQSPDVEEQIGALEKLLKTAPGDEQAKRELSRLQHFRDNPLEIASQYEEQGELDKAITMYTLASQNPNFKQQWDQIFLKIIALENLKKEQISHIKPELSIARVTFVPSLLYFVLILIQVGINPIAHPEPLLWLGLPWVVLGGFMIALASVRSRNRLWSMLFSNPEATGSPVARALMSLGGWALVLIPYSILSVSAIFRLMDAIK
jgi:tetratricopeptide (TPR) repeat protein